MSEAITKATDEQIAAGMRELFKDREQRYEAWEDVLQRIYGAMAALSQTGQGGQGDTLFRQFMSEAESAGVTHLSLHAAQPAPVPQDVSVVVDVMRRTAMARSVFDAIRKELPGFSFGPWPAFDADEQQRIVDSLIPFTVPAPVASAATPECMAVYQSIADGYPQQPAPVASVPLIWQDTLEGRIEYILQDDASTRGPRIVDIAYSAWHLGRSGKNKDDGGPCDWFNDTKPMVMEAIEKIRQDFSRTAQQPAPAVPAALPSDMTDLADIAEVWACNPRLREFAATMQPKPATPAVSAVRMWDTNQIAMACVQAEICDGHCESLLLALESEPTLSAAPKPEKAMTDAARDVLGERQRQIIAEGWTPDHDDQHQHGELSKAASAYAWGANYPMILGAGNPPDCWPWDADGWKPKDRRSDLIKAGALILAEIERLDRAAAPKPAGGAS